jgi:tRNA(fMet)-specific endonuclease VapC
MAGNNYLLDTNIVIAILNQESTIEDRLSGIITYIPSIVLGELYFGALNSGKPEQNIENIHTLIADYAV